MGVNMMKSEELLHMKLWTITRFLNANGKSLSKCTLDLAPFVLRTGAKQLTLFVIEKDISENIKD